MTPTGRRSAPDDGPLCTSVADVVEPLEVCARSLAATGNGLDCSGPAHRRPPPPAPPSASPWSGSTCGRSADRHTEALDCITRSLGLGSYDGVAGSASASSSWPRELENLRPLVALRSRRSRRTCARCSTPSARSPRLPPRFAWRVRRRRWRRSRPTSLAVALLQKEARVRKPLRIVPLVETAASLAAAGGHGRRAARHPGSTARSSARARKS